MLCTSALMVTGGHSATMSICGYIPTQATVACRELNPGKMVTSKYMNIPASILTQYQFEMSSVAKSELALCECERICMQLLHQSIQMLPIRTHAAVSVAGLNGITTPAVLRYIFYCTGDEARLTDCVVKSINSNICGNRRVGLMCETGNIQKKKINLCVYFIKKCYYTEGMMFVDKPQPVVSPRPVMLTSTQTVTFTPSCSIPMSTTSEFLGIIYMKLILLCMPSLAVFNFTSLHKKISKRNLADVEMNQ